MKIKDIEVIVASPGRNFVTVKVITDDGLQVFVLSRFRTAKV